MVQEKGTYPEMHTVYLLKYGQTLENTKPSERTRISLTSKSTFQRFVDYTTTQERIAEQQEKEAAKIAAMRKATREKTKTWTDTIENIAAKRREELLSKKKKTEEERNMFVKDLAKKRAAERVEVVQQARKLIMHKKPLCRRLNRSFLVSECLRELDAQVAFQKIIRALDEKQEAEYANSIRTDVAIYEKEKRQQMEEREKKTRNYKMDLKKQIEENEQNNILRATKEMEIGKEEQKCMSQNLQMAKEKEMQDILNKKKKLQQFFKEVMDEKKRFELEMKRDEEFDDRALTIYHKAKDQIKKIHKSIKLKEKQEKDRQEQIITEHYIATKPTPEIQEQKIFEKAVKEKEMIEMEKQKAKREQEETMRNLIEEYRLQDAAMKTKQKQEEKTWKDWEMMQRFKKSEYDRQLNLQERKRQWQQEHEYKSELWRDFEEKKIEKKREEARENAEVTETITAIEEANRKILLYGDKMLEESKGVRPLHPIIKAVEDCRKEMGLLPRKKREEPVRVRPKRKQGVRRETCTKPVPVEKIYYFQ